MFRVKIQCCNSTQKLTVNHTDELIYNIAVCPHCHFLNADICGSKSYFILYNEFNVFFNNHESDYRK